MEKPPKQTIEMTAAASEISPTPRMIEGSEAPNHDGEGSSAQRNVDLSPKPKKLPGLVGYLLAGIFGGLIVAGSVYVALSQEIPGLTFADPATRRQLEELLNRTNELEKIVQAQSAPASAIAPSAVAPSWATVNDIRARVSSIVNAIRDLDDKAQSLSQRLHTVEQKAANGAEREAMRAQLAKDIAPISERLAAVERQLHDVAQAQKERQAQAQSAALTLALSALRRAVDAGLPFGAELTTAENLSANKLPIYQLEKYKESGVPTIAALRRSFPEAAQKATQDYYQANSNSLMGAVVARTKAAIQITRTDSADDTIESVIGRMEAATKSGDLQEALKEAASLPASARSKMQPWLDSAKARVTAEEVLKKIDQDLLATLTKNPA